MQVILSVPRPSLAAKLVGQILSIICSTILDKPKADPSPLMPGELTLEGLFFPEAALEVVVKLFLPVDVIVVAVVPVDLAPTVDYLLVCLAFCSYTKSTAC